MRNILGMRNLGTVSGGKKAGCAAWALEEYATHGESRNMLHLVAGDDLSAGSLTCR